MRRHTERKDIILLAELLKFKRVVALIAIKDEQPTRANHLALCVLDEVLQPLNSNLISSLAVVADCDSLVAGNILLILGREVVLALEDDEGWDSLPCRVDALDDCSPLSIALLHHLWPSSSL